MTYKNLEEVSRILATRIGEERKSAIKVNVMPMDLNVKSVLQRVCEVDPRLIPCISTLQIKTRHYGIRLSLEIHISYTNFNVTTISKLDGISDFYNIAYHVACMHGSEFAVVYPIHLHKMVQDATKEVLELPHFLNCLVSGVSSEIKIVDGCSYMAQIVKFSYVCPYREQKKWEEEISLKIAEISKIAKLYGIEDWKKAYEVVRYCTIHWNYGRNSSLPGLEYTSYGAIVNNTAVCMGIALGVCAIFKELGIPCRYVRGIRNGEGHAWNMIYLRGGWFYIDVTDAISMRNPLFHWGMTSLHDRVVCEEITEKLVCNCTSEYIKKWQLGR